MTNFKWQLVPTVIGFLGLSYDLVLNNSWTS